MRVSQSTLRRPSGRCSFCPWSLARNELAKGVDFMEESASRTSGLTGGLEEVAGRGVSGAAGLSIVVPLELARFLS